MIALSRRPKAASVRSAAICLASLGLGAVFAAGPALAAPSLVVDMRSGAILHQEEATASWFPASLTKLMTAYVALKAVRDGEITLDTPLLVSQRAARMAPSKMGFKPGTEVTLENALVMIMVKSANDTSVTIAEGIGGSVEGFAARMNAAARALGMTQSAFTNPNGLPDARQVTSARDMAILALALEREFPQHRWMWTQGAMQLGNRYFKTHNGLVGRYPGADGMKTGFTCASGFNVVASATRGGRAIIAVVMGATSARERTARAAELLDRSFAGAAPQGQLSGLPSPGIRAAEDQRGQVCVRRSKDAPAVADTEEDLSAPLSSYATDWGNPATEFLAPFAKGAPRSASNGQAVAARTQPRFEPVIVQVGRKPGWTGRVAGPVGTPRPAVATAPKPAIGAAAAPVRARADAPATPMQLTGAASRAQRKTAAKPRTATRREAAARQETTTRPGAAARPAPRPVSVPAPRPVPRPAPQASVSGATSLW